MAPCGDVVRCSVPKIGMRGNPVSRPPSTGPCRHGRIVPMGEDAACTLYDLDHVDASLLRKMAKSQLRRWSTTGSGFRERRLLSGLKLRLGGGGGEHNCRRDMPRAVATKGYRRVRAGVSCPPGWGYAALLHPQVLPRRRGQEVAVAARRRHGRDRARARIAGGPAQVPRSPSPTYQPHHKTLVSEQHPTFGDASHRSADGLDHRGHSTDRGVTPGDEGLLQLRWILWGLDGSDALLMPPAEDASPKVKGLHQLRG